MRLLTLSVFALIGLALTAGDASAFGKRKKKECCEPAPACEPACPAPAPVCAPAPVYVAPAPVCHTPAPVCAPAPTCAPACEPAPVCAPACEPACEPAKKKCGLFGRRR